MQKVNPANKHLLSVCHVPSTVVDNVVYLEMNKPLSTSSGSVLPKWKSRHQIAIQYNKYSDGEHSRLCERSGRAFWSTLFQSEEEVGRVLWTEGIECVQSLALR